MKSGGHKETGTPHSPTPTETESVNLKVEEPVPRNRQIVKVGEGG